jgi:hypothetical protein
MPVNIYQVTPERQKNERVAWLCDGEWLLCPQIDALSEWLEKTGTALAAAEYVADVGFCWRRSASSGGPVLEPLTLRRMADLGMSLFLSEYSGFAEEDEVDGGASE